MREINRQTTTPLAVILTLAMSATAFFTSPMPAITGKMGLCLPSPNEWMIPEVVSWAINLTLLLATAVALYFSNKSHTFVPGSGGFISAIFLVAAASNPWISGVLTSSIILAACNLACLTILFFCYRQQNATQEIFVVATILSLGSMIQYAFILMIPAYIIVAILMKCFRFKEFLALLMGLAAPYWVGIGLGIIPLGNFAMPTLSNLFTGDAATLELFIVMVNIGVTAVASCLLGLNNLVKLYAGNPKRRLLNLAAATVGIFCLLGIIFDYTNMTAYMGTIYMIGAVQLANLFALWHIRREQIWALVVMAIYVGFFLAATI